MATKTKKTKKLSNVAAQAAYYKKMTDTANAHDKMLRFFDHHDDNKNKPTIPIGSWQNWKFSAATAATAI